MASESSMLTEERNTSEAKLNPIEEIKETSQQIDNLSEQLEGFFKELKETQSVCKRMQEEGVVFREKLAKASDISVELDRVEAVAQGVADSLNQKTSQLNSLSNSIKEVSSALRRFLRSSRV